MGFSRQNKPSNSLPVSNWHLSLPITLGLQTSNINSVKDNKLYWDDHYDQGVWNPSVSNMTLAELCQLNRTLSTGWHTYSPFKSLRYLEVCYFLHGLLKIPAASALQELMLNFRTLYLRTRKPCDILLNFSQLPQLTTLRVHNLKKDGLTLTGKSRSVRHLKLIYSSIEGDEVFRNLSSSLESLHTVRSSLNSLREQEIWFPRLRSMEMEGNLSFLPVVLFHSTASLELVTVHCGRDWDSNGLEKVLNKFLPGGKPRLLPSTSSCTVTLIDYNSSLALFLKSGRNMYTQYVTQCHTAFE
jgi:hypothetical protein